jgi:hypothetical protein
LEAVNTAAQPEKIIPTQSLWHYGLKDSQATRVFPANSVTVLRFE